MTMETEDLLQVDNSVLLFERKSIKHRNKVRGNHDEFKSVKFQEILNAGANSYHQFPSSLQALSTENET
jgi:hypothetical protein